MVGEITMMGVVGLVGVLVDPEDSSMTFRFFSLVSKRFCTAVASTSVLLSAATSVVELRFPFLRRRRFLFRFRLGTLIEAESGSTAFVTLVCPALGVTSSFGLTSSTKYVSMFGSYISNMSSSDSIAGLAFWVLTWRVDIQH